MNNHDFYSILYEKKNLSGILVYFPLGIIIGSPDNKDKIFYSEEDYPYLTNEELNNEDNKYVVSNFVSAEELKNIFPWAVSELDTDIVVYDHFYKELQQLIVGVETVEGLKNCVIDLNKLNTISAALKTSAAISDPIISKVYDEDFVKDLLAADDMEDIKEYVIYLIDEINENVSKMIESKQIVVMDEEKFSDWHHENREFLKYTKDTLLEMDDIDELKVELEGCFDLLIEESEISSEETKVYEKQTEKKPEKKTIPTTPARLPFEPLEVVKIEPKKLFDCVTQSVIGQDDAVKRVISSLYKSNLSPESNHRNRCLLYGPTGTGKTQILVEISKYLDKKMIIVDCTQLSRQGYVGRNLEDYLERLVMLNQNDVEMAENSIFVLEEVDKLSTKDKGDVYHERNEPIEPQEPECQVADAGKHY